MTQEGVQWKVLAFADEEQCLDSAEQYYLEYSIHPLHSACTLVYEYDQFLSRGKDPFRKFLQSRSVGDSLEIITFLKDTLNVQLPYRDTLLYRIRIDRMRTKAQLEDRRIQELTSLDLLARSDSVQKDYRELEGGYYRSMYSRDTTEVRKGKEIVIHYQGRTLDGRVFDDSRQMAAPMRFIYGNEDQVLKGVEIALAQMTKNELAEIILPSWLAFGSSGSADGRIPPYSTVIYQVEVLEVSKY